MKRKLSNHQFSAVIHNWTEAERTDWLKTREVPDRLEPIVDFWEPFYMRFRRNIQLPTEVQLSLAMNMTQPERHEYYNSNYKLVPERLRNAQRNGCP